MNANVHSIETFGSVDGPGIRFVVFLQGCHLRCRFCHNADTWSTCSNQDKSADELLQQALRYQNYWGKDGGITVSGGEPLLQIDFLLDFFKKAKDRNIHTCLDTAGEPFTQEGTWFSTFQELMNVTDLVLLDMKHIDPKKHLALTGKDNANILDLYRYLDKIHKPIWVRQVLVPGLTDDPKDLVQTRDFLRPFTNIEKIEVLPYHSLGAYKWKNLNIPYTLEGTETPTDQQVQSALSILNDR